MKVSCDEIGTHSAQRFLQALIKPEEREVVFNATKNDIKVLALHPFGNYVALVILEMASGSMLEHYINELLPSIAELAVSSVGIFSLSKIISKVSH